MTGSGVAQISVACGVLVADFKHVHGTGVVFEVQLADRRSKGVRGARVVESFVSETGEEIGVGEGVGVEHGVLRSGEGGQPGVSWTIGWGAGCGGEGSGCFDAI